MSAGSIIVKEGDTLSKTNESSAAVELIRAQGEQMEHIDPLEYLRRIRERNDVGDKRTFEKA